MSMRGAHYVDECAIATVAPVSSIGRRLSPYTTYYLLYANKKIISVPFFMNLKIRFYKPVRRARSAKET